MSRDVFDQEFVKQNIVSKELSKMLHQAFGSRLEGDDKDNSKIDHQTATKILESADKFVSAIEEKLSK